MNRIIGSWKKLWKDLGARRWLFLFLVGILLVVIAVPMEKLSSRGDRAGGQGWEESADDGMEAAGSNGTGRDRETSSGSSAVTVNTYEAELEVRLTRLLSQIQGAGQVQVMVTVSRSSQQIIQSDMLREESTVREIDSQGGSRDNRELREESQTVLVSGGGTAQPYVVGEIMPQVEGVVVACEGGDRPSVQAEISAAVQALFDLEPHKIKVCKMASP